MNAKAINDYRLYRATDKNHGQILICIPDLE